MHKMGDADKAANRSVGKAQALTADTVNSHGQDAKTPDLVDPVSQRMLPAASTVASVHQGRIYYFEDRANRDLFEAEPEKYVAGSQAIGQQIGAQGKSNEHSHQGHGCC
jgi:YHS domain-containing protein